MLMIISQFVTKSDLLSLEEYSLNRDRLREEVLVLKKDRKIQIGINVTLLFNNSISFNNICSLCGSRELVASSKITNFGSK